MPYDDRIRGRWQTAKKEHICSYCDGMIRVKERYWVSVQLPTEYGYKDGENWETDTVDFSVRKACRECYDKPWGWEGWEEP